MRGKKHDVCHDCRQHKIGCDGAKPACSQCRLTGRVCRGYLQDLVVFHHDPTCRRPRSGEKTAIPSTRSNLRNGRLQSRSSLKSDTSRRLSDYPQKPTWEECVAILVQHYIPKDEIPFLLHLEPSKSRICGGWVQALPHVSQDHEDFKSIVSPAVRALTMAMMVGGTYKRDEYLDTYGAALEGIRTVLGRSTVLVGSTLAIASMCLALSEVLVPTSNEGYRTHLRGVAAMMHGHTPNAFKEGVAHLMFVGVRPLVVLDAIIRRKKTFLMDEQWQTIPFSVHPSSRMQELLGHATAIPPLLEALEDEQVNLQVVRSGFLNVLATLEKWEHDFVSEGTYRTISLPDLDLSSDADRLPNPCFAFADVSNANTLTHCWAFGIVCLLQLSRLDIMLAKSGDVTCSSEHVHHTKIECLCNLICQGLPYLLQRNMRLYGTLSAGFPLHMVSESLQTLRSEDSRLSTWCIAIKEQMQSQRIALYEETTRTD